MPRNLFAQTFLAAAFLVLAAAPGAGAQKDDTEDHRRRPPPASGPAEITFYSDTGLRGTAVTLAGSQQSFASLRFNDKARSVEVKGGVWQLCSDSGLRGRCEYVDRTVRNLGDLGLSGNISSAQLTNYDMGPGGYDITFFANGDYRGAFLGFDEGEASFGQFRFNDTASSVMINRGTWLVCEHADYRGRCEFLDASVSDLSLLGLNDAVTSFRRYDVRREGPWLPPVPEPVYPPAGGGGAQGIEGEQSVFFPAPTFRGARISNREGAATRFCQDNGFAEAAYKAPGPVLSDVLCR
ncbi:beta/gamma crystallin-related protein [Hyphomonas sp.]|uniref:beta/gamma crystallin-related protein n=1 Tax=Hyphomonas sp. TaxID=87 RepID=UPI00391DD1AD